MCISSIRLQISATQMVFLFQTIEKLGAICIGDAAKKSNIATGKIKWSCSVLKLGGLGSDWTHTRHNIDGASIDRVYMMTAIVFQSEPI